MKGVIPAAGKGSRLRPFTKAYPKELLPVGKKAVIEHCIKDMKEAGITDICVVVGWKQHAILDYLGSGESLGVKITYVVQDKPDGLAGAIKAAQHFVKDEEFAVVLGDNYVDNDEALKELVDFHKERDFAATIGTFEPEDITSYGVINPGKNNKVQALVEKPSEEEAPSEKAISGMYVFKPKIFGSIDSIEKGKKDEFQLTDAIDHLRNNFDVGYKDIKGNRIDVGTPERLKEANRNFEHRPK